MAQQNHNCFYVVAPRNRIGHWMSGQLLLSGCGTLQSVTASGETPLWCFGAENPAAMPAQSVFGSDAFSIPFPPQLIESDA